MKHLVYLAIATGALAVMGCDGVAPPKPSSPPAADPPAPTAAEYSCGDGYVFDSDQVPGPEGAVVNDVFYWGSSTSGAARCYSDTRNNSMVGRVESNADDATGATVMSVTLPDELRWYFILEFSDGTYCSAATAGDGRATCFATVKRDATGFRVDDLPAVPLPVPEGAPERPPGVPEPPPGVPESPPGGPGPGGGDQGGGHTGAPEPEEPGEEGPAAPPPATSSTCTPVVKPDGGWREGETISGCADIKMTIERFSSMPAADGRVVASADWSHSFAEENMIPPGGYKTQEGSTGTRITGTNLIGISKEISLTSEGDTFKLSVQYIINHFGFGPIPYPIGSRSRVSVGLRCSYFEHGHNGECGTDEQGNPSTSAYPHKDAWLSLVGRSFSVECRWSATVGIPIRSSYLNQPPGTLDLDCR